MNEAKLKEFFKDDVKICNNETMFCNTPFQAGGFPHLVSPMASTEDVTGQIKRDGVAEEESDLFWAQRQGAALETAQAQGPGVWPSSFSNPQPCLFLRCSPEKPHPPHGFREPVQTVGLCDSTIPCPERRSGPCTDSWKSLRPLMTPFKASSVWLFDS